ncbi:mediator of RNA polymerase II transcription subunit 15-like [Haliotis asinina]|uniref:mediator of RNA polymerase II transcription subunit 15-like n=1 Tax=Haliotis asinina TaxID=109174 RepID=UPI00353220A7
MNIVTGLTLCLLLAAASARPSRVKRQLARESPFVARNTNAETKDASKTEESSKDPAKDVVSNPFDMGSAPLGSSMPEMGGPQSHGMSEGGAPMMPMGEGVMPGLSQGGMFGGPMGMPGGSLMGQFPPQGTKQNGTESGLPPSLFGEPMQMPQGMQGHGMPPSMMAQGMQGHGMPPPMIAQTMHGLGMPPSMMAQGMQGHGMPPSMMGQGMQGHGMPPSMMGQGMQGHGMPPSMMAQGMQGHGMPPSMMAQGMQGHGMPPSMMGQGMQGHGMPPSMMAQGMQGHGMPPSMMAQGMQAQSIPTGMPGQPPIPGMRGGMPPMMLRMMARQRAGRMMAGPLMPPAMPPQMPQATVAEDKEAKKDHKGPSPSVGMRPMNTLRGQPMHLTMGPMEGHADPQLTVEKLLDFESQIDDIRKAVLGSFYKDLLQFRAISKVYRLKMMSKLALVKELEGRIAMPVRNIMALKNTQVPLPGQRHHLPVMPGQPQAMEGIVVEGP